MNSMTKSEQRPVTRPQNEGHQQVSYVSPRVNITETKDGYLLQAEMPGVNKDGLEISLEGNELTLTGRRHADVSGLELLYRESNQRDFRRTFVLDPTIDCGKIEAKMDNGVLLLTLPKAEQVKPRKIKVT
jgi:HSP20 family protein